jgi:hypothetical protein
MFHLFCKNVLKLENNRRKCTVFCHLYITFDTIAPQNQYLVAGFVCGALWRIIYMYVIVENFPNAELHDFNLSPSLLRKPESLEGLQNMGL